MPKKIVVQIKAAGAIGNEKIDSNPLYADAIGVEEATYQTDGTEQKIIDFMNYVRGVLGGTVKRDDKKFPGIVWKPETGSTVNGTIYVKSDPDAFVIYALSWVVTVLNTWSKNVGLKSEYVPKDEEGRPAAYDSYHVYI